MKFHFKKMILWLHNGNKRELRFEPNKVNVITGESLTGKTSILDIIDYCFFASKHNIAESIINENVAWYGITFGINDKAYTIARKSPIGNRVSNAYYFSSFGEVPAFPNEDNTEESIKTTLEVEFNINKRVKMPFGGRSVGANTKVSLRYFFLFNTISEDIITNSEVFFDKQNEERYREALPRIFDLAVGIDNIDNILNREKRDEIEIELRRFERRNGRIDQKRNEFSIELAKVIKQAQEYGLITEANTVSESINQLKMAIEKITQMPTQDWSGTHNEISNKIQLLTRKIRNLKRFSTEYSAYKTNLKDTQDSIKPIVFLNQKKSNIIKTSIFFEMMTSLENDFKKIRSSIRSHTPVDGQIIDAIEDYQMQIVILIEQLSLLPEKPKAFDNDEKKYIFIGEVKAKFNLYLNELKENINGDKSEIEKLTANLNSLNIQDIAENKEFFISMLEEVTQEYITSTKSALENYGNYHSFFNYKEKKFQLRKPKTDFTENVGSSSNHMFMHLFLFLGLHEVILRKDVPFVPSFLIIDQPSRPYYGEDDSQKKKMDHSDTEKITIAFQLLNDFISTINTELKKDFQMIVFEHVPPKIWSGMKNVHLVEEFRNGNALIPTTMH